MSEEQYKNKVLAGYIKSPELMSRMLVRMFVWQAGKADQNKSADDVICEVRLLLGKNEGLIIRFCEDIAERLVKYASSIS